MLYTAGNGLFPFIKSDQGIWFRQTGLCQFFFARPAKTWHLAKVRTTNASAHWMQCNDGSDEEGLLTTLFSLHLPSAQCPRCQIGCTEYSLIRYPKISAPLSVTSKHPESTWRCSCLLSPCWCWASMETRPTKGPLRALLHLQTPASAAAWYHVSSAKVRMGRTLSVLRARAKVVWGCWN